MDFILIITVIAALKVISRIFLGFKLPKLIISQNMNYQNFEKPPNRQCGGFWWFLVILGCFWALLVAI